MTYSLATLKFYKRNFFRCMGFTLIPALLLGIFAQPFSMMYVIVSIGRKEQTYTSFIEIFRKINYVDKPLHFIFILFIMVLSVLFVSILVGSTRQKMRYGSYMTGKTRNFLGHINDNFTAVFKYVILLFVALEIISILLSTFLYTSVKLFKNALPACIVSTVLFTLCALWFLAMTSLAIPNMTMKGYGISKSIGMSIYELSARSFKVFFAMIWIFIILAAPMVLLIIFPFKHMNILLGVFSVLFYWVLINYIVILMYVVYFDVEEIEREDQKGE